jgi:asparagine synthetase B (glutamine-hydrolysing)
VCGICGLAARQHDSVPLDESTLRRMTDVIAHRGPDDAGHRRATHEPRGAVPRAERAADLHGRRLSLLAETLHLDRRLALVDNMLLYFDKISMAASLEVRVPFMDHDVVSFCAALPDRRLVRGTR